MRKFSAEGMNTKENGCVVINTGNNRCLAISEEQKSQHICSKHHSVCPKPGAVVFRTKINGMGGGRLPLDAVAPLPPNKPLLTHPFIHIHSFTRLYTSVHLYLYPYPCVRQPPQAGWRAVVGACASTPLSCSPASRRPTRTGSEYVDNLNEIHNPH